MGMIAETLRNAMTNTQELDLNCKTCSKCGTPIECIISVNDKQVKVPIMCQCEKQEHNRKKLEEANKAKIQRLESLKKFSLMDASFEKCTFENWRVTETNKTWYELGKNYCANWEKMKKTNTGMMLHGNPGAGKSYLSYCIANELLKSFIPVIATSSINIINKIYETYSSYGEMGEVEIINQFKNASLVILDDLGAEHDGRTGKEKQIIYSLLDTRIRCELPTIITTNLTPEQLKKKLTGVDGVTRTYDRIIEGCTPLEMTGPSYRVQKAKEKVSIIRNLVR